MKLTYRQLSRLRRLREWNPSLDESAVYTATQRAVQFGLQFLSALLFFALLICAYGFLAAFAH